eukprot:TRINITY_DN3223_c0_g1_i5.p1 TRINITY_DN3223_c0_g1~~TRINITY_DN3223_c0_g1_i5.p1  ORF type:complete len:558 (-),score=77.68 TRINITY_DN3223_c0_g1_i5:96-1769(-)
MQLFFSGQLDAFEKLNAPTMATNPLSALLYAEAEFLRAVMTFHQRHIDEALHRLELTIRLADESFNEDILLQASHALKPPSFFQSARKSPLGTEIEHQAELAMVVCYSQLYRATLDFVLGHGLDGGLHLFRGWRRCRLSEPLLDPALISHFKLSPRCQSSVAACVGIYRLAMSLIPASPLLRRSASMVGLERTDWKTGVAALQRGAENATEPRGPVCALLLCAYYLVLNGYLFDAGPSTLNDVSAAETLLSTYSQLYPGCLFMWMTARLRRRQARLAEAEALYLEAVRSSYHWTHFAILTHYELAWVALLLGEWHKASSMFETLCSATSAQSISTFYRYGYMLARVLEATPGSTVDYESLLTSVTKSNPAKALPSVQLALSRAAIFQKLRMASKGQPIEKEIAYLFVRELVLIWAAAPHMTPELCDQAADRLMNGKKLIVEALPLAEHSELLLPLQFLSSLCHASLRRVAAGPENTISELQMLLSDINLGSRRSRTLPLYLRHRNWSFLFVFAFLELSSAYAAKKALEAAQRETHTALALLQNEMMFSVLVLVLCPN